MNGIQHYMREKESRHKAQTILRLSKHVRGIHGNTKLRDLEVGITETHMLFCVLVMSFGYNVKSI